MRHSFASEHMMKRQFSRRFRPRCHFPWRRAAWFIVLLGWLPLHAWAAARFSTSIDRDSIVVGESITLTLTFEGASPRSLPQLPNLPGLQLAGGMSQASNMTQGPDGQMHVSYSYSVPLIANQPGDYTIPAFQVELEGQRLSSAPLRLKVLREDPSSPPVEFGNRSAFLWLVLPRKEFYVGETFVAELRLYIKDGVRNIDGFQPPGLQTEGFNSGQWVKGQNFRRLVGGRPFTALPVSCAVTPVKTGPLKLGEMKSTVVLNPPDIFESVWGRGARTERVAIAVEGQTIQVFPLPTENVPADFTGAIGSFTLTVAAGPTNVAVGDPITVRVQISGRGGFDAVKLPEQKAWVNFKAYQPVGNLQTSDPLGLQGTKTFEQIVSPESADLKELPAFSFSFFDPEARAYRTLKQPAQPLVVRPAATVSTPLLTALPRQNETAPPPAQDIVHIKTRPGSVQRITPPLLQQPWFVAVPGVPVLAWMFAVGWRRRADALANNPRLRRQRAVAQLVRAGLVELRTQAAARNSDAFFATLVRLLQEQLGERLDAPASAITEAVVDEKLRPRGMPEALLKELHELFQACNLARYAPVQSSRELTAFIPRVESVLARIQEVKS